jgi:hypothetical protein
MSGEDETKTNQENETKTNREDSRKELLNVISYEYQHGIEDARHIDNKASNMLATAGTLTGLLFGFGTFLVSNIKPTYEFLPHAMFLLVVSILFNISSVFLCILAFRMQRYQYAVGPVSFHKEITTKNGKENYDEDKINKFFNYELDKLQVRLMKTYIKANRINFEINTKKWRSVLWAQILFIVSLVIIPLIVGVVLQAYVSNAIRFE